MCVLGFLPWGIFDIDDESKACLVRVADEYVVGELSLAVADLLFDSVQFFPHLGELVETGQFGRSHLQNKFRCPVIKINCNLHWGGGRSKRE